MISEIERRYAGLEDFEVRSSQRIIEGIVAPFNKPTKVGRYTESFGSGAFSKSIAERGDRIKLQREHSDPPSPIGRAVDWKTDNRYLRGAFKVSKTLAGDEALELAADGTLDSFSIGFQAIPGGDHWSADRSLCTRSEVRLMEVSLVAFPMYNDAVVTAVRHEEDDEPEVHGLSLEVVRRRLILIKNATL